ncbi:hypothetical protein ANTQUA_LOCUS10607 [Anthophora quadrimaculata]
MDIYLFHRQTGIPCVNDRIRMMGRCVYILHLTKVEFWCGRKERRRERNRSEQAERSRQIEHEDNEANSRIRAVAVAFTNDYRPC